MELRVFNCPACGSIISRNQISGRIFACQSCGSLLALEYLQSLEPIRCSICDTVNESQEVYCSVCGAALKAVCPYCYTPNRLNTQYCEKCGINLQRAWQRKKAWLSEKGAHDQERQLAWEETQIASKKSEIERLMNDLDEPEKHSMAIYCLQQFGKEVVESLIEHLRDDDPDARYGAARALGLINDERAIEPLMEALRDREAAVRYWAAEALGRMRAEKAARKIAKLLRDSHSGVREIAKAALEEIGSAEAGRLLKKS